jgi:2-polyprenyl-3-methyl-5-hydroxy-6-metoxy-1,4-benzoquinol methylase
LKKNPESTTCPVCEIQSANFFTEKNGFDLYRCGKCGLIFVWPTSGDYTKIYSEDYFSGAKNSLGYADYEGDKEMMAGAFSAYLEKMEKVFPKKGKLLDVGAATGHFVELAKEKGWDASGIEISQYAAEIGGKKGLKIITGKFETHHFSENYFDIVTFWDVLEHFEKPELVVRQARKILKSGGILALNTPDSSSLAAKFFGRHWHALVPPNHLHIFSRKNMVRLLAKNGFEVIETARVGKNFSLRFVLKVLANWQKMKIWEKAYERAMKSRWGNWKIPLDIRDNMFVIAKKQS